MTSDVKVADERTAPVTGPAGAPAATSASAPASAPARNGHTHDPKTIVSSHRTSEGVLVWARCACGSLLARRIDNSGTHLVAASPARTPSPARA